MKRILIITSCVFLLIGLGLGFGYKEKAKTSFDTMLNSITDGITYVVEYNSITGFTAMPATDFAMAVNIPTNNTQLSNGMGFITASGVPAQTWSSIASKPTTIADYGITDSYTDTKARAAFTAGTGITITGGVITNTAVPANITLTAGNRITITGTYPNFTISYIEPTINHVTRAVNTNYTISTKQAQVYYAVPVTATNPLLVGTSIGTAYLEYSINAGSTWTTATTISSSSSVGLSVTIALTTGGNNVLSGVVPANALVRVRTVVTGTATVGSVTGQEIY